MRRILATNPFLEPDKNFREFSSKTKKKNA